jgi:hypothetical protein
MLRQAAISGIVMSLILAGTVGAQEECGHCHEERDPQNPPNLRHQMTEDTPRFAECNPNAGHGHDCENGDGDEWDTGPCGESHPTVVGCSQVPALVMAVASFPGISRQRAMQFAQQHPRHAVYDHTTGIMRIRGCNGLVLWSTVTLPSRIELLQTATSSTSAPMKQPPLGNGSAFEATHLPKTLRM